VAGGPGRLLSHVGAAAAVVLLIPATGSASPCVDPGPAPTSITNDAALEVRELRRELSENCAEYLSSLESSRDRLDLGWWGAWALVGVLLGVFAGSMLNAAFRFWDGDE